MRIVMIADGRSPIARNWIAYLLQAEVEVHLVSTYPSATLEGLASLVELPVAFGAAVAAGGGGQAKGGQSFLRRMVPVGVRTGIRQWLGPLTLPQAARRLRGILDQLQPDLVHAMRIPYEGMLAAEALAGQAGPPLLVSVWGNDFTLHARSNPWMARLTRRTMRQAQALHTDCRRDGRLAREWGFAARKPHVVLPGAGGVQLDIFYPPPEAGEQTMPAEPIVINPRGIRAYVRNDTFFRAARLVLDEKPEVRFLCLAMAGEAQAEQWVAQLGLAERVSLLPLQPRSAVAELFRAAQVAVSPSTHDGTPNTLLEAMACGCFPLAGDIESLREWIEPGANGLLFDPGDPVDLAGAILTALSDPALRQQARQINLAMIAERAGHQQVMAQALAFYRQVVAG